MHESDSRKFLITNTWTYATHGHARDELLRIKCLIAQNSADSKIISIDSEFGDVKSHSWGSLLQKLKLDHSRIFKAGVDSCLVKDLSRGIQKAIAGSESLSTTLVLTSSRIKHLTMLDHNFSFLKRPRIRVLDAPRDEAEWEDLVVRVEDNEIRPIIAMEVKSSVTESQSYLSGVKHVPSHQGLHFEGEGVNVARNRVGVFWPVGRSFKLAEVESILEKVETLSPIVKLPNGLDHSTILSRYPKLELIPKDIGNSDFNSFLSKVKVAILGHKDYFRQSSGYLGYFLANNVPVLVSNSNSFFEEFSNLGQLYAMEETRSLLDLVHDLADSELVLTRSLFSLNVEKAWKDFIFEESTWMTDSD